VTSQQGRSISLKQVSGVAAGQVATCLRHIHNTYPHLVVGSVRVEPAGQRSNTLIINETIVFRFPRTLVGVQTLPIEASILRTIRGRLPLATPELAYENLGTQQVGTTFIGYPRIAGEPLWRHTLLMQDDHRQRALAAQLACFLQALHSVSVDALPGELPVQDGRDQWADLYGRIHDKLFPLMRSDRCEMVAQHFESYLDEMGSFAYQPALRHGDFGPSNILFDAASGTISGIVDFGSAGLGDPAVDVAGLIGPVGFGETLVGTFSAFYPRMQALLPRARFYLGTFALQEALWGLEHGDAAAFASGIAAYR